MKHAIDNHEEVMPRPSMEGTTEIPLVEVATEDKGFSYGTGDKGEEEKQKKKEKNSVME